MKSISHNILKKALLEPDENVSALHTMQNQIVSKSFTQNNCFSKTKDFTSGKGYINNNNNKTCFSSKTKDFTGGKGNIDNNNNNNFKFLMFHEKKKKKDENLGDKIFSKLNESEVNFEKSQFASCFGDNISYAKSFVDHTKIVTNKMFDEKEEHFIILPPMLIESRSNFALKLSEMHIVCHAEGPVIPVITDDLLIKSPNELNALLCFLYSINGNNYVDADSLINILKS